MRLLIWAAVCAALMSSASAQTIEPVEATSASPEAAPSERLPQDALELAKVLFAKARDAEQCRYAFTQTTSADAQVGWSGANAAAGVRFDPRQPIGSRWSIVTEGKRSKQVLKLLIKDDKKGYPTDLMAAAAEGLYTLENLKVSQDRPDMVTYSFTPAPRMERQQDKAAAERVAQLRGTLEIDRTKGRIQSITLRTPEDGLRVGMAKIKSAMLSRTFDDVDGKYPLVSREVQSQEGSALFYSAEVTATTVNSDFAPICDPAEVARIAAMEAAVPKKN